MKKFSRFCVPNVEVRDVVLQGLKTDNVPSARWAIDLWSTVQMERLAVHGPVEALSLHHGHWKPKRLESEF